MKDRKVEGQEGEWVLNGVETKYRHTRGQHNDRPMACDGWLSRLCGADLDRSVNQPDRMQNHAVPWDPAGAVEEKQTSSHPARSDHRRLVHPSLFIQAYSSQPVVTSSHHSWHSKAAVRKLLFKSRAQPNRLTRITRHGETL